MAFITSCLRGGPGSGGREAAALLCIMEESSLLTFISKVGQPNLELHEKAAELFNSLAERTYCAISGATEAWLMVSTGRVAQGIC